LQYQSIAGSIDVVGIADATQSDASVCQGATCASVASTVFHSTSSGGAPLVVTILAKDVDGFELNRTGEAIAVVLRSSGATIQTIQAVYSPALQRYTAEVGGLIVTGDFSVALQTLLGTDEKALFAVVCAAGYEATPAGECTLPRSVCDRAIASTSRLAFTARDTLQLSSLGSASAVELLPVTQTTRFDVRGGQATVVFERPGSFLVQIVAIDGQKCTMAQACRVDCPVGYQEVNGNCQSVLVEDVCSGLVVKDRTGALVSSSRDGLQFAVGDQLQLALTSPAPASAYRFQLVPTQGTVTGSITETIALTQTGSFSLSAQYVAAGRAPVQCQLIAALNVSTAQICDRIQAQFSIANSTATGARSNLQAVLTGPRSRDVTVLASPLDSSLRVPLVRSGASADSVQGSATLPSTGLWSLTVAIDLEPCTKLTQTVMSSCLAGFNDDGQGRCVCPEGLVNVQGKCQLVQQRDPCQDATVLSSMTGALQRGVASVTLGTKLSVSAKVDGSGASYTTLLIPKQGTKARALNDPIVLDSTGSFSLNIEYAAAGGSPKQCTLFSSLSVQCAIGEVEVDGRCLKLADNPCDRAIVDVFLSDDPAKGMHSVLNAAVNLSVGLNASLVATPVDSTVGVPLSRRGELSTWEGSASLPSTGVWALQFSVGQHQCALRSPTVTVRCMGGLLDDSGQCTCPAGLKNRAGQCIPLEQEVDICSLATVSTPTDALTGRSSGGIRVPSFRPGSQLQVSLPGGSAMGYATVLLPTEGAVTRAVTDPVVLSRSGSFALRLKQVNSTQECVLMQTFVVKCGEDEQEIDNQCKACPTERGFWFDPRYQQCRKRPRMAAVASSDRLVVTLQKTRATPAHNGTIEIRLASGDVPEDSKIEWRASTSNPSLRLCQPQGTVHTNDPVARVDIEVSSASHSDTAVSGPLLAGITIFSTMPEASGLFELGTSVLTMAVEVLIEAAPYLIASDVTVQTSDEEQLANGAEVNYGDAITVIAQAFDFERLAICRKGLPILAILSASSGQQPKSVLLDHQSAWTACNWFALQLPDGWIDEPGSYLLRVASVIQGVEVDGVVISFVVVDSRNKQKYVAAGIAAAVALVVLTTAVLVYKGQGSFKERAKKYFKPVLTTVTTSLEVWDMYGDYYSYRSFVESKASYSVKWLETLMTPYTVFFGISCIVSAVAIGLKIQIFVGFVNRIRQNRVHDALADQIYERANLKRKLLVALLLGLLEDLPMGTRCAAEASLPRVPSSFVGGCAGVFSVYFFVRSTEDCLGQTSACRLSTGWGSANSQTLLVANIVTSFVMLGWKVGQVHRMSTMMKSLTQYLAFYEEVTAACGEDQARQLEQRAERSVAHHQAQAGFDSILASSQRLPRASAIPPEAAPAHAEVEMGASAPLSPAPEFIGSRNVQAPLRQSLPQRVAPNDPPSEVRGMCDGCLQNVLSTDEVRCQFRAILRPSARCIPFHALCLPCHADASIASSFDVQGRHREHDKYYHAACIVGWCSCCGLIIHRRSLRQRHGEGYMHAGCV
jgi:hypothetical protein